MPITRDDLDFRFSSLVIVLNSIHLNGSGTTLTLGLLILLPRAMVNCEQ